MNDTKMEAAIIYEPHLPDALRRATLFAGEEGYIASVPQLLHARVGAGFDNIVWNSWFTANSEECVARTPQGNHVLVEVHGGGVFSSPERILTLYHASVARSCKLGFTGPFAGKILAGEARDLLAGKLPDGSEIPVYPFEEFRQGIAGLPRKYAVILDFETARQCPSGYQAFDDLREDPLMIMRAGGAEAAAAYLDRLRDRGQPQDMGNWHIFPEVDPDQPQASILLLYGGPGGERARIFAAEGMPHLRGVDNEFGLCGSAGMINMGRYVAVAPHDAATSVRDLPFML
jgi:acetyl esterase/lipase